MALIVTTWSPSTCKCVIKYEWDTGHPAEFRLHKVVDVKHCADHPIHHVRVMGRPLPAVVRRVVERLASRFAPGWNAKPLREHPRANVGERLEASTFHEDHAVAHAGREHWRQAVKDNPHWADEGLIALPIEIAGILGEITGWSPHSLHGEGIHFKHDEGGRLLVTLPMFSAEDKAFVQTAADAEYGLGAIRFI